MPSEKSKSAPFTVSESPLRAVTTPLTTSPFAHGTLLPASTVDAMNVRFDTVPFATTGVPCASAVIAASPSPPTSVAPFTS